MATRTLRFPLWAKITTVAIVSALLLLLLRSMGSYLNPFLWALVTAYLFNPLVRALAHRSHSPRFWWVLLIYLVMGLLIFTGFDFLWPRLVTQFNDLQVALPEFARRTTAWLDRQGSFQIGGMVLTLRPAEQDIAKWFGGLASTLSVSVPNLVFGFIERLILLIIYLVVTFYLLLQADQLVEAFYGLIPTPYRGEIRELGHSIDRVLGAYIRSQLLLIVLMAVLTYIPLSLLGVKYALVLAIATGFLEIVPFVGPYTAAGSAVLVALVQSTAPFGWPNWLLALVVGLVYLILRQAEDHLIIPNVVGHIVQLHPVIVIFSVLAGGNLAGALGLLIAVPVAATVRIILVYLYAKLIDSPAPVAEVRATDPELLDHPAPPLPAPAGRGELSDGTTTR